MDPVTHGVVGAALAHSASIIKPCHSLSERRLYWQLGAFSALIPDLDYLLFWLDPLAFLAYWHRSFSHSLLLAPMWSLAIAVSAYLLTKHRCPFPRIWLIATLGVLSHCLLDGLTPFGTQWLQPLSDTRFSANLLLVVDGYFSLILLVCFVVMVKCHNSQRVLLIWLVPTAYLLAVAGIKHQIRDELLQQLPSGTASAEMRLLPQPFSPLLWQALIGQPGGSWQARVYHGTNTIPLPLSVIPSLANIRQLYRPAQAPDWQWRPLWPSSQQNRTLAQKAWQQPRFRPFRDFAHNPVLYHLGPLPPYSSPKASTCVWFSDLRYHWPGIPPPFRFGLCQLSQSHWQLHRLPYFYIPRPGQIR